MKSITVILLLISLQSFGQIYKKFEESSLIGLEKIKTQVPLEYYSYFKTLISKRDSNYLRKNLSREDIGKAYLIEGYNFETNKYGLFEEYYANYNTKINEENYNISLFYLDKQQLVDIYESYFLYQAPDLKQDNYLTDTIYPRKYRYGAGDAVTDSMLSIFGKLERKADADGIVIEKYCRIETMIDLKTKCIQMRFCFPVTGQREFKSYGVGMMTNYPAGLDFWLFVSPYFIDKTTK